MKANLETIRIGVTNGLQAELTNYGARLMSLFVPWKGQMTRNVVLGFKDPASYFFADEKYFGAIVGRYCNRIAQGRFVLNGINYQLARNQGEHHLHGGIDAFHTVIWNSKRIAENAVEFSYISPDGEEAFPGTLEVRLIYAIVENELHISLRAVTDKTTIVNLTPHPYLNLLGEGNGAVLDHELEIFAEAFTPVDKSLIPTGEIRSVAGTPFDFRQPRRIGEGLAESDEQLSFGNGYDHNFVLKKSKTDTVTLAARITEPSSGLRMELLTTEPGLQFYSANWLSGKDVGYSGKNYRAHEAFCLEPQHFPDSPNQAHFPPVILRPGERYHSKSIFRFETL